MLRSTTMLEWSLVTSFWPLCDACYTFSKDQFGGISYERAHNHCAHVSYDYCYSSDDNAKSCPHVTSMDSIIGQIEQEMKSYKESMENMTITLID